MGCAPARDPSLHWALMLVLLQTPPGAFPMGELYRDARSQPVLAACPSATELCGRGVSPC